MSLAAVGDLGRSLTLWVRHWGGSPRGWPSSGCSPKEVPELGLGVPVPGDFWAGVWGLCPKGILGWGLGSWTGTGGPWAEVWDSCPRRECGAGVWGHGLGWGLSLWGGPWTGVWSSCLGDGPWAGIWSLCPKGGPWLESPQP